MASVAGNLQFLTQFIRFHSFLLDDMISWILMSKKSFFCYFDCFLIFHLISSTFGHMICDKISIAFFISPSFQSFGNVNQFRKFVPKIIYSRSKFLSNTFKLYVVSDVSYLYRLWPIYELIGEFFLFITISNDELFLLLNKSFLHNNGYQ